MRPLALTALTAWILAIGPLVSVRAFHLGAFPSGIRTPAINGGGRGHGLGQGQGHGHGHDERLEQQLPTKKKKISFPARNPNGASQLCPLFTFSARQSSPHRHHERYDNQNRKQSQNQSQDLVSRKKQSGFGIRGFFRRFLPLVRGFSSSGKMSLRLRRWAAAMVLFAAMTFSALDPAWAATNGRSGGSFGRSRTRSRPSITRVNTNSNANANRKILNQQRNRPAPIRVVLPPPRLYPNRGYGSGSGKSYHTFHQATGESLAIVTNPDGTTNCVRKVNPHPFSDSRASDITVAVLGTALVTRGVVKRRADRAKYGDDDRNHPLGPGLSVWSLTVSLDVADLGAPTSVIRRMQRLAETTPTDTREGLQSLLSGAALELSRQLDGGTISSVESQYQHYLSSDQALVRAERQYNRVSARERSKFERESWSNYNGKIVRDEDDDDDQSYNNNNNNNYSYDGDNDGATNGSSGESSSPGGVAPPKASLALVQLHLVIEGNAMEAFGTRKVETRSSLREALIRLSGDVAAVKDCVIAGEVLWAPTLQSDQQQVLTQEDVYVNYPRLWPLDYAK